MALGITSQALHLPLQMKVVDTDRLSPRLISIPWAPFLSAISAAPPILHSPRSLHRAVSSTTESSLTKLSVISRTTYLRSNHSHYLAGESVRVSASQHESV